MTYVVNRGKDSEKMHEKHANKLPFFECVLADFLRNPQNASLLPK